MAKIAMMFGMEPKKKPVTGPPDLSEQAGGDPMGATEPEGEESGGGLTPDMLSYHGGEESCGACSHFTAPATCDRFPDPVEDKGWCKGFESGGMDQAQPSMDEGMSMPSEETPA